MNVAYLASVRDGPFNFQGGGGYGFFLKKYSDSQYSDFGGGKKNNLIQSFCHITWCYILEFFLALCATKKINVLTLVFSEKTFLNKAKNHFCGIVAAILKMETAKNLSMSGINSRRWNRTMLNLCGIVVAILKMATGRNLSMSGINSGHHNLPTYEMALKSDNVELVRYCGGHFENGDC